MVDDIGGAGGILGTTLATDVIRQRIHDLTEPQVVVSAIEHEHEGRRLVLVNVSEGMEMVSDAKGRSSRRHGTDCLPLSISQAATLNDDRRRFDWSASPSDLEFDSVDDAAVQDARSRLSRYDDERRRLATATTFDLLGDLGLVREGRLTRAAEALFCARPGHPPFAYVFRDTAGGEVRTQYREAVPSLIAYREVLGRIVDSAPPTPVVLRDGQQLELHDFPLVAVREALGNALLHRDYRQPESIHVDHSPNVLSFVLQRGQAATEAVLQRLSEPGIEIIAPVDRSRQQRWQLSPRALTELRPALSYRTISADEVDRKIVEFVRENSTIDNKTLQIFFDLDVNGAAYRLRTLVQAGVLRKLGEQARGPGIRYGPGPSFPKR